MVQMDGQIEQKDHEIHKLSQLVVKKNDLLQRKDDLLKRDHKRKREYIDLFVGAHPDFEDSPPSKA